MPTRKKSSSNSFASLQKLNNNSDEILYGIEAEERKKIERLTEIDGKIKNANISYENLFKTNNVIEFLTQSQIINTNRIQGQIARVNSNNNKDSKKALEEILQNENVRSLFNTEMNRIETYFDYRIVDAYIPQVSRCINLFRDSIMSPDDIDKISVNISYNGKLEPDVLEDFNKKAEKLKKSLNFDTKARDWIRSGLVDGDTFVAVLKIDNELNKMLLNENYFKHIPTIQENEEKLLSEGELFADLNDSTLASVLLEDTTYKDNKNTLNNKKNQDSTAITKLKKDITKRFNDNISCISGNDKYKVLCKSNGYIDDIGGLKEEIKLNGAILRTLEPENTVKLENSDGINFGYLYIQKFDISSEYGNNGFGLSVREMLNGGNLNQYNSTLQNSSTGSFSMNMTSSNDAVGTNITTDYFDSFKSTGEGHTIIKEKLLTDLFVKGISKKLNKKIIEDNSQFKEIIYSLVKKDYIIDKQIQIIYFSPEEVKHYKPEGDNTYGISTMSKVLFYAKLFLSTLLTQVMQKISRGRDKRVVYVETGIEDDLEDSIQSVIREFKAKELQSDVLKSITSVFRRVGTFEDYYLPKIDGEVPIDFDTISGMDTQVDDDFLEFLLKSIVSGMGIPNTYTDSTNEIDFSRSLLMQNTTFVRDIVCKQAPAQAFLSEVFSQAFNYEYYDEIASNVRKKTNQKDDKENLSDKKLQKILLEIEIDKIGAVLPSPQYLEIINANEQIQNYQPKIEFIVNNYYGENPDEEEMKEKEQFKQKVTRDMVTSIDWNKYDKLYEETRRNNLKEKLVKEANTSSSSSDSEDLGDVDDDMDMNF